MASSDINITAATTSTVEDFIAMKSSDELTYYNYSILEYSNGYDMFITNLLYDYDEEFSEKVKVLQLTDRERSKYRYKPYLLAYDIYGSAELDFVIMMLNGIIDPKEFDFSRVKVIKYADLNDLLTRITSVNEKYLNTMKSKLKTDFKENDGNDIWTE
jgi:hypothetical protein